MHHTAPRPFVRPVLAAAAVLMAAALSGCSGSSSAGPAAGPGTAAPTETVLDPGSPAPVPSISQPAPDALAPGACRRSAPDLLALGQAAAQLSVDAPTPPVLSAVQAHQGNLSTALTGATGAQRAALQEVVATAGLVRIRVDSHSFDPSVAKELQAAYDRAVAACTPGN